MRTLSRILPVLLFTVLAAACGKAPAEQALKTAEAAIEAARPEVEKFAPAEWTALSADAAAARSQFEKGEYKEALAGAQALLPRVQAATAAAQAKKTELIATFTALKASLPGVLDTLGKQLTAYAAMKKLPAGIDKAGVAAAQAELPNVSAAWTSAVASFDAGDLAKAVDVANQVKAKVEDLSRTFLPVATGVTPAPTK
jgi:hypothetical protein